LKVGVTVVVVVVVLVDGGGARCSLTHAYPTLHFPFLADYGRDAG